MELPWISRGHHAEVVAAKDALIRSLESQIEGLQSRLAQPISVEVRLPEDFAVLQPAMVRRKSKPAEGTESATPTDWATVDENDLQAISRIAAEQLGPRYTQYALSLTVKQIRRHILAAKAARRQRVPEAGQVTAIQDGYVPAHIQQMIEQSERG